MKLGPRIYNLFPALAGPVDAWATHLPRIAAMQFDWIYVNPFHETGESGSLYAVKDYYRLDPAFRPAAAGDDDAVLRSFVDAASASGLRVMMDLVINHSARDAGLTQTHREWYTLDAAGALVAPSASDPANPSNVTVWTDLAEFNYRPRPERDAMLAYFSDVIAHYIGLGVRGFRCDAAYKVPADVWRVLIERARKLAPGVVFAAENLGAPEEAVSALRPAGFDYLFNSSKWWDFSSDWLLEQYDRFRHIAPSIAFPESHDTPRLAAEIDAVSPEERATHYRFRYLFAAFFSAGVLMPMGFEFGFERALDVVRTEPDQWETPAFDLSGFIASVNAMKAATAALNADGPQRAIERDGVTIGLHRTSDDGRSTAIAFFNPGTADPISIDAYALLHANGQPLIEITPGASARGVAGPIVVAPHELRVFASVPDREAPGDDAPATAGDAKAATKPCVIEAIVPQIDCGRHPAKRIAGERVDVTADIFREGHDAVAAVLRYRQEPAGPWYETPMRLVENDRWTGSFVAGEVARYSYAIEAWPDAFGTWQHDTGIKHAAGQSIALEIIEGRALVDEAAARAHAPDRAALHGLLADLDAAVSDGERAALLLSDRATIAMNAAPDRTRATRSAILPLIADRARARTGAWYEFFPRSQSGTPGVHGTFADAARALPRIRELGFDVVYLPPIHPIGVAFRKGRNNSLDPAPADPGSPWAIGNAAGGHCAVEPLLGTLADFDAFVAAASAESLEVALDYALQCSPDHPWVREHPEWFTIRPDGSIKYAENPPKKYQDIVNFNWYGPHAPALWNALRDIVLFWMDRGVRIFRVDNPHTKPFAFWEWMIADVQGRDPKVVFLAEAFTRPKVMQQLAEAGFSQSYTYFTWRNTKYELTTYLTELSAAPLADTYRPNFFTTTPDILPPFLQSGNRAAFLIRLYLAATLSGSYGVYSGYELCEHAALPGREEYADSEKYQITVRDWNAAGNINAEIRAINRIRRENPALDDWRNVRFLDVDSDRVLFYRKSNGSNTLLVAINLDPYAAADVHLRLPLAELGIAEDEPFAVESLLTGEHFVWRGSSAGWFFEPSRNTAAIFRIDTHTPLRERLDI